MRQQHDRVQTDSHITTVDSCFDFVGSLQHGVASCEVFSWSTDIHKPQTQNPNLCQLANVTCKTCDKGQQEKSRITYRCHDKEPADRHKLSRRKISRQAAFSFASFASLSSTVLEPPSHCSQTFNMVLLHSKRGSLGSADETTSTLKMCNMLVSDCNRLILIYKIFKAVHAFSLVDRCV